MADAKAIEERAMQIYDAYNYSVPVPWVDRPEPLKERYRVLAKRELEAEHNATEKIEGNP